MQAVKDELWVDIPEFEDYQVSNYGRVFSKKSNRFLAQQLKSNGCYAVKLSNPKAQKTVTRYVHRLVAQCYILEFRPEFKIRHKDGNRLNNHVENFELYGYKPYKRRKDLDQSQSWAKKVRVVGSEEVFSNVAELSKAVGVSTAGIYACLRGEYDSIRGLQFEYVH